MLMDLKGPLKQGDKVPVTLEFEKAGKVKLSFDVQGVGAKGPPAARIIPAVTTVIPARRSEADHVEDYLSRRRRHARRHRRPPRMSRWKIARRRSVPGYKAVFTVPHGCAGSATTKIRVQIPEGVIAVKPMPKAGWSVEAISGKYATEYSYHGRKFSEGVKEVVWSGGKLADSHYDEFVMSTYLTGNLKPNTTLYFPVVQECEQGVSRWIDIPAQGAGHSHDDKSPAPGVKLMPKP